MISKTKKSARRVAGVEVCHSTLHLAVWQAGAGGVHAVRTRTVVWRKEAASLHSKQGILELAAALKGMAQDFGLAGQPLFLSLTGDYCVTRVVTGATERVRHELAELDKRSRLYLSLGHGQKTLAGSVRQIDARHQHALLTVVNQRTLDSLVEAADKAGLQLARIEPSLVSLCRLVGNLKGDVEGPALIVNVGERGVELGISHQGQLLLDYRPGGREAREEIAEIVESHLARLQRYCDRYARIAAGKLRTVYLSGDPETAEVVGRAFAARGKFTVRRLDQALTDGAWSFSDAAPGPEMSAALGVCLLAAAEEAEHIGPNLMERMTSHRHQQLWPLMAQTFWPVAAALVAAAIAWGVVLSGKHQQAGLEQRLADLDLGQRDVRIVKQRMARDEGKLGELTKVQRALGQPPWDEVASAITHCLPADVWLESLTVDAQGHIQLQGASFSEDGVYEFIRWLRELPAVQRVALGGTQPSRLPTGLATKFDVHCDFADQPVREDPTHDNT